VTSGGVYTAFQALQSTGGATVAVGTTGTSVNDPSVKVLLHFEGANGSTTITDSSTYNNTFTCYRGAKITTADSKFGSSCLDLNTGTYPAVQSGSITFPSNSYSIEFWLRTSSTAVISFVTTTNNTDCGFWINFDGTNFTCNHFAGSFSGTNYASFTISTYQSWTWPVTSAQTNVWHHICYLCVSNNKTWLFFDGNLCTKGSTDYGAAFSGRSGIIVLGDYTGNRMANCGRIDDFRIVIGANKYNTAPFFTPPTAAYTGTITTFPSPATQGQLWSDGTNVYVCTVGGNPGSWRQFTIV